MNLINNDTEQNIAGHHIVGVCANCHGTSLGIQQCLVCNWETITVHYCH